MDATCDCGAALHAVPLGDDDWQWIDHDGQTLVDRSPAEYRQDPRGWWERLARENIAAYSDLSARANLGMLGWTHMHRPAHSEPYQGIVPYCCDMPMRLVPRGWTCRVTNHATPLP